MAYLDNGSVRLGLDLSQGGAVTYLSKSGSDVNVINSADRGREVQLSFYSGPNPFQPAGATLSDAWKGLGWNPIQCGDAYGNPSKVTLYQNDGHKIHLKCIPKIWPLKNYDGECVFDITYRLNGSAVEMDSTLVMDRPDLVQYPAHTQELPAVYTNGPWYKLVTYIGDRPFSGAPLTTVVDKDDGKGWPWLTFFASEHWAALLDDTGFGVGVFMPDAFRFGGGFAGAPKGSGGPKSGQTGYIAPNLNEILDHNAVYRFHNALIVGTVDQIRAYALAHRADSALPDWKFEHDRRHFTYAGLTDSGWPIDNALDLAIGAKPGEISSPETLFDSHAAKTLAVTAAATGDVHALQAVIEPFATSESNVFPCWGPGSQRPSKTMIGPVSFPVTTDGKFHTYHVDLSQAPGYAGAMMRLKLLVPSGHGTLQIKEIGLKP